MKHFAAQNTTYGTDASRTAPEDTCAHKNEFAMGMTVLVMLFLFFFLPARICVFLLSLSLLSLLVVKKTESAESIRCI